MCGADVSNKQMSRWLGVGVYPTPALLVRRFANQVAAAAAERFAGRASVSIRDVCAGDGRLGHAVARRLVRRGFSVSLELLDVDAVALGKARTSRTYATRAVVGNLFCGPQRASVDLVLSNPPYLSVNREDCRRLGLQWDEVERCGRNLYSIAIARCIADCGRGGVVGFLGPHGWLTNRRCSWLRGFVASTTQSVGVHAFGNRRLFRGVHQDTSIQTLNVASSPNGQAAINLSIRYDDKPRARIALAGCPRESATDGIDVRVGAFVWNRQRDLISRNGQGLRVVYGGNISALGQLELDRPRYAGRQFLKRKAVPTAYVRRGPCLLLKRSLRGGPGRWSLDCVVVESSEFEFVPENHVIVVSSSVGWGTAQFLALASHLRRELAESLLHCGHPNISAGAVRRAVAGFDAERGTHA